MAQASGGYSSYPSFVQYYIDCNIASYDPANNRTLVNASGYVYVSGSSASSAGGSGDLYIDGQYFSGSVGSWSAGRYGTVGVVSGSAWIYHDANGQKGAIGFSGSSSMAGLGSASASGALGGFPDYDRSPGTPSSVTAVINSDKSVTVTVAAVSSPAGTATYHIQYSQNGGSYTGEITSTSLSQTYPSLTKGQTYTFRAWATNSDGTGGTATSASYFLPSGGKWWNGTSFVPVNMFMHNGTSWVPVTTAKRHNGTTWVDLS